MVCGFWTPIVATERVQKWSDRFAPIRMPKKWEIVDMREIFYHVICKYETEREKVLSQALRFF